MRTTILIIVFLILLQLPAASDGFTLTSFFDEEGTVLAREEKQEAIISYDDGIEDLTMIVGIHARLTGFAWIFPIPASPDDVEIDITESPPYFRGFDTISTAKAKANSLRYALIATPFSTCLSSLDILRESDGGYTWYFPQTAFDMAPTDGPELVIHKTVSEHGMTTQLVSMESTEQIPADVTDEEAEEFLVGPLVEYLQSRGMEIPSEARKVLLDYVGLKYSFVVSWDEEDTIESARSTDDRVSFALGVRVKFPTERIFFPLKLTSVYGWDVVPADIVVGGYWTPYMNEELREFVNVSYLGPASVYGLWGDNNPYADWRGRDKLTRVVLNAQASLYKSDLWFENKTPEGLEMAYSIVTGISRIYWTAFIIAAFISGMLAGSIAFPVKSRLYRIVLPGIIGLTSAFTLLSLALFAIPFCNWQGLKGKSIWRYVIMFLIFFIFLATIVELIIKLFTGALASPTWHIRFV